MQQETPTKTQQIEIVNKIFSMERLTFMLHLRMDLLRKYWRQWDIIHHLSLINTSMYIDKYGVLMCYVTLCDFGCI